MLKNVFEAAEKNNALWQKKWRVAVDSYALTSFPASPPEDGEQAASGGQSDRKRFPCLQKRMDHSSGEAVNAPGKKITGTRKFPPGAPAFSVRPHPLRQKARFRPLPETRRTAWKKRSSPGVCRAEKSPARPSGRGVSAPDES